MGLLIFDHLCVLLVNRDVFGLTASPIRLAASEPAQGPQHRQGSMYNICYRRLLLMAGLRTHRHKLMLYVVGELGRLGLTASPVCLAVREPSPGP